MGYNEIQRDEVLLVAMMLGRVQLKSIPGKSNAIERGSLAIWTGTLSSGGRL